MGDDKLVSMLERATADPPAGYTTALLDSLSEPAPAVLAVAAPADTDDPPAEPYVSDAQPRRRRFPLLVSAAAVFAVAVTAVLTVGGDDVTPAANADRVEVVVDGDPVPVADLDATAERVARHSDRLGVSDDELPVQTAVTVLFERFVAEAGRAAAGPVSEADIDAAIREADSIEAPGRRAGQVDPADAISDPSIRSSVRASVELARGMGVLNERFGTPVSNDDAEARWREWFAGQLDAHDATVSIDGERMRNEELVEALLLFRPAG